jgi:DNA processing protein
MAEWADQIERLRLVRTEGVGPVTYRRLLDRYHSPAAALDALPRLARAGGRSGTASVVSVAEAERELERTSAAGGRMIFLGDPEYPPLLAMMDDAPPCLILRGEAGLAQKRCVAAVGGRNASANGQRMAETLAAELAATLVMVSGLARGIDTAVHTGAMRSGRTIAVIAGGIDQPYPPENADLHRRIGEAHLLISAFAHWHRAAGQALSSPQPDHRRPVAWGRGGGGGAAIRQPDHRPDRSGSWKGGVRRPRLAARSRCARR